MKNRTKTTTSAPTTFASEDEREKHEERCQLADELGLRDECGISTKIEHVTATEATRPQVPCLKTTAPLTVALIERMTGKGFELSVTHKQSGLAVRFPQFRYGRAVKYAIPATAIGLLAAKAAIRALLDCGMDWTAHVPVIPPAVSAQWAIAAACGEAMEPVFKAADQDGMAALRTQLGHDNPNWSSDKITATVREVYWWNPTGWAMTSTERAAMERRLDECAANPLPLDM